MHPRVRTSRVCWNPKSDRSPLRQGAGTSSREVVLPLYYSSSAPEAIHHTTHWIRVLHHNGGPNQYKSCVARVVHCFSLDSREAIGRGLVGGRSSRAPQSSNLKGFARTRYLTPPPLFRARSAHVCHKLLHRRCPP